MAKPPGSGRCVHCLRHFDERNWDHVFPKSWYPDTTLPNIEKWQIPTCKVCNSAYGRLEEDLIVRLALCLDPEASESAGVIDKALRSIDPFQARDRRDRKARQSRRDRLFNELITGDQISTKGIYPNFGERWSRPTSEQVAIHISVESVRRLSEKIVRGIVFLEDQVLIEPPFSIEFYALTDEDAAPVVEALAKFGQTYAREPGIEVKRVVAPEDEGHPTLFSIAIFGRFKMYAAVSVTNG